MKSHLKNAICMIISLLIISSVFIAALPAAYAEEPADTVCVTICGYFRYDHAATVFDLVNQNRQDNEKSPLAFSTVLTELAMQRAAECAMYHNHMRPDGRAFNTVDENGSYSFGYLNAENIGIGYTSPEAVMTGWMNSEGHRANILNTRSGSVGIGCCLSGGTLCWVQLFGTGTDPEPPSQNTGVYKEVPVNTTVDKIDLIDPDPVTVNSGSTASFPAISLINAAWKYGRYNAKPIIVSGPVIGADGQAIASVDQNGTVTALSYGSGLITYRLYPGQQAPYTVALNVRTQNGSVLVSTVEELQSPHPYEADVELRLQYVCPSAVSLKITFAPETEVEDGYDYITILDGIENEIGSYTGTELAGMTVTVPGNTVTIVLESDFSETRYGFKVSKIEFELMEVMGLKLVEGSDYYFSEDRILGISAGTSLHDFSAQFVSPVTVRNGNGATVTEGYIGTGFTASCGDGIATAVIKYDTDGDGIVSQSDYLMLKAHFKSTTVLTGVYYSAGDIDGNGKLTVSDYIAIKRKLVS